MFEAVRVGVVGERSLVVEKAHTAARGGSGLLLVFSTPQMVALMEGAAVMAVDPSLPPGYQTVGTHLDVSHLAATPPGHRVRARAELTTVEGRKLTFSVEAYDEVGMIGKGELQRYVVDVSRFMQKAQSRGQ